MNNFVIVKVDSNYCNYLRRFDKKVYFNSNTKSSRPFIGVLFKINNMEYFAPLSSPKPKHIIMHNADDFIKLDNGNLGVINLNNMIPVKENLYKIIDLNKHSLSKDVQLYYTLLNKQYAWINSHKIDILNKSNKLYRMYNDNKLPINIKTRCCNFKLLEKICSEYSKVNT